MLSHAEPSLLHVWLLCTIVHILRETLQRIGVATRVVVISLTRAGDPSALRTNGAHDARGRLTPLLHLRSTNSTQDGEEDTYGRQ